MGKGAFMTQTTPPIRIVVADDHTLVRQSVARLLNAAGGMEVVAEAGNGADAVQLVRLHRPDVAVMDVSMPGQMDGLAAAAAIRENPGDVHVVLLTMHDDDTTLRRATEVAVDGYVSKTASTEEVVQAVRAVVSGGAYVSSSVAMRMMRLASGSHQGNDLTDREVEVLRLLATGSRIQEIADALFLSPKTVKNHLTSVYTKLGVETAAQAVAHAYQHGLVSVS
jgi:DNA-binding NarL/FixJ family response regulator